MITVMLISDDIRVHPIEAKWRIGEVKGLDAISKALYKHMYITADGDELKLILESVEGIPKTKSNSQTWFGDDARFIMSNVTTSGGDSVICNF